MGEIENTHMTLLSPLLPSGKSLNVGYALMFCDEHKAALATQSIWAIFSWGKSDIWNFINYECIQFQNLYYFTSFANFRQIKDSFWQGPHQGAKKSTNQISSTDFLINFTKLESSREITANNNENYLLQKMRQSWNIIQHKILTKYFNEFPQVQKKQGK